MKATVTKTYNNIFVLNESDVQNIWNIFRDRINTPTIVIKCIDDLKREFTTWKSFTQFNNSKSQEIIDLSIHATSDLNDKSDKRASIEFGMNYSRTVYLYIEANEKVTIRLKDDIENILEDIKPWYQKISFFDFTNAYLSMTIPLLIIFLFFYNLDLNNNENKLSIILLSTAIVSVLFLTFGHYLNKIKNYFFPKVYFELGAGIERYKTFENIRWTVIVGFVVSLLASLGFSLL